MTLNLRLICTLSCLILLSIGGKSETQPVDSPKNENLLSILAWNVESGGGDSKVIAERLARLDEFDIL